MGVDSSVTSTSPSIGTIHSTTPPLFTKSIPSESLAFLDTGVDCFVFRQRRFFQTLDQYEGSIASTASQLNVKYHGMTRSQLARNKTTLEFLAFFFPQIGLMSGLDYIFLNWAKN